VVINVESACVDNYLFVDDLTFEMLLDEPVIGSTDPNIPIDNNCTDDQLHFRIREGSRVCEDKHDECDVRDAIPIPNRQ
jgi:hypothetical protein